MPTTSTRWAVAKGIVDLLRAAPDLANVTVEPGWPGDNGMTRETVWIDELAGDVVIPVMTAGRKSRDDNFTVPLQIAVRGLRDLDTTMTRLTAIVAAVEDVLADDPSIDNADGVIAAEISSERLTCGETPDGPLGFAEVVVSVHARLT